MQYDTIGVVDREHHVAITLNRPEALNSISPAMIDDLGDDHDPYSRPSARSSASNHLAGRALGFL